MQESKKVLIISFHYLPEIMAASFRVHAWAKYLRSFGWEPYILTNNDARLSQCPLSKISNICLIDIDEKANCIVYRTPFTQRFERVWKLRKKLSDGQRKYSIAEVCIRKILSFFLRNFLLIPDDKIGWYQNAYNSALKIIKKHNISVILSTGAPWTDFKIANNLSKKTGLPWVADYRDPWSKGSSLKIRAKDYIWYAICRFYEKRIVKNASAVIHISEYCSKKLETLLQREVRIIPNGYDPELFEKATEVRGVSKEFVLSCVGTRHPNENTKVFLEGFYLFTKVNKISSDMCKVVLVGHGHERIKTEYSNFIKIQKYFTFIDPLPQEKAIEYMKKSHILLYFPSNIEGICSVKMFDYLASTKPILASPDGVNNELVREILVKTQAGIILSKPTEVADWLKKKYQKFIETGIVNSTTNLSVVKKYSRLNQALKLSTILNEVIR